MKAQEAMARRQGAQPGPKAQALLTTRQGEVRRWEEARNIYRGLLETLSLTLHPFRISDSVPQTSAQVESQRQALGEAITT
jgi:hypothetical protein